MPPSALPASVSNVYIDQRDRSRPYVVRIRIGALVRFERYPDPSTAERGRTAIKQDVAALARAAAEGTHAKR